VRCPSPSQNFQWGRHGGGGGAGRKVKPPTKRNLGVGGGKSWALSLLQGGETAGKRWPQTVSGKQSKRHKTELNRGVKYALGRGALMGMAVRPRVAQRASKDYDGRDARIKFHEYAKIVEDGTCGKETRSGGTRGAQGARTKHSLD